MLLKQTKIVATISDQRCDVDFIKQLFDAGMNVVRMNTAHLGREGAEKLINNVRTVSNRIAILMDTKGPEVRTTVLAEPIPFKAGDRVKVVGNPEQETTRECISVSYPHFVKDLNVDGHILIDDGDLELVVVEKTPDYLLCEVQNEATLGSRKSVNVPGVRINLPSLTEKDRTKYTAQDWEGFQELVSKSNIQDKELILRVLSMYQDPEQREQEIKNISSVYKTLADEILPQLRRSRLTLNYEIIGKSDEEIANLADSDAKQLNIEELLYATTLTKDAAKQEAIFTKATQIYPNDFRAYNNLGKLAYQAGDLDKAESYFKKALSIKDAPEANMNLGLIALTKGDRTAAESYLSKASGSKELNEALGNLYVAQGQYDKAVSSFGDTKTNSAALAQILAKDYNKAKNTLAAIERPDAYTDYLMAVLGARTNNTSMVTSSLKNAIAKEPALAKKATSDLEFAKYFTNTDFMNIIK